jgi:hypothetical protein
MIDATRADAHERLQGCICFALGGALLWLAMPETRTVPGPAALAVTAG